MSKFAGLELPVDAPIRLVLVHPATRQPLRDEAGKEAFIEHHSGDSEVARKHQRAVQRRRLAMRGRMKITPEELEAEGIELLAGLTTGWHLVSLDGKAIDVPFTIDAARELYGNAAVAWIREQVDESASDRGNLSPASSTS